VPRVVYTITLLLVSKRFKVLGYMHVCYSSLVYRRVSYVRNDVLLLAPLVKNALKCFQVVIEYSKGPLCYCAYPKRTFEKKKAIVNQFGLYTV
jgi:hypothetical protein